MSRARTTEDDDVRIRRLDALLAASPDDELLHYEALPRLPSRLLARYARLMPEGLAKTFARFLAHIDGEQLPFDYCDEVARLYAAVFRVSRDPGLRRLALRELLALGVNHRRYAVADIVRELLWESYRTEDVPLVLSVLRSSPHTWWYHNWQTFGPALDARLQQALEEARRPATGPA